MLEELAAELLLDIIILDDALVKVAEVPDPMDSALFGRVEYKGDRRKSEDDDVVVAVSTPPPPKTSLLVDSTTPATNVVVVVAAVAIRWNE